MEENTVVAFRNPSNFQDDPLTEVLRAGARELLAQAVEAEVAEFLEGHATLVDDRGRRRIVRNGHLPERLIQTKDRPGGRASAACPGSESRRGCRRHPVHVGDPAALSAPHHARAELVENLKGRLVARKTKLPLKLHGGHAGRLTGDQISGPEPDVQRSVATLHHCSHRQPGVLAALAAAQDARAVFKVERLSRRAAVRAGKAVSPAGFLQVGGAGRIIGEKSLELG